MQARLATLRLALAALCATAILPAQVLLDDFNRPDSSNLGPNWTEHSGNISIQNGTARGTDTSLMTFNGPTGSLISVDIFHTGTGTQYIALVHGFADLSNNLFVKVQDNSAGSLFDRVFFYYGNNGSGFGSGTTIFEPTPFASARMSLSLLGSVATLTLDTNFDGIADYTYTRNDVPTTALGTGTGLGFYGSAAADNFALGVIPEPEITGLLLCGLGVLLARRLRSHPAA